MGWRGLIEEYREFLPVTEATPVCTLHEGDTPLIRSESISKKVECDVYFKYEGLNPTGSFKDRGMTVAISKALEEGSRAVICASTGNTSASAAAYSARAGIKCVVLIPEGKIALGKLSQALMHGAQVLAIRGNFDVALKIVRDLAQEYPITLVNSLNQYRVEGQKTGAFEICDALGSVPDYLSIPVGNAGNITAYWQGFKDYAAAGKVERLPKMIGFQAAGAAPIVLGHPVDHPETIATAIRIGNPARWQEAVSAAQDSGGFIDMVTDDEIIEAYQLIAATEGVFAEPASAASVAGLIKMVEAGRVSKGVRVVCVLTGHGLKDPDTAIKTGGKVIETEATLTAVEKIIFGGM
ncbi:MAG: threonine synthase [Candidatus Aquicultor sp.]|nr:threonine synthase [Candidatus Aquicultor sp.]